MLQDLLLPLIPSILAACLVLVAGTWLARHVPLLARYSIPAPIVGGLLFALLALAADKLGGVRLGFDTAPKGQLLLVFFACIGLTADLALLKPGGIRLLRFLLVLFPFLVLQDALGVAMAYLLGLHPVLGLIAGSITLVGGHGTGAAYADRFAAEYDVLGVMGLTMTSATIGLVLGGVIGGPVAGRLIARLTPSALPPPDAGDVVGGPSTTPVTTLSFTVSLAAALIAVVAGGAIGGQLRGGPVTVPDFLWCLLAGLVLRNGAAALGFRLHDAASELIGSLCLSVFLAWTMMTLRLDESLGLAGPLLVIIAAQTVLVALWGSLVMFRALGRDYEGAIMVGAFCGFAMGATATAVANMQALTRKHGPAPQAFIVVPIAGAFFIDLMNLAVLTLFLLPGGIIAHAASGAG
ncbi:MAG: sodium/glutamate symporter [Dongiaceae bacterium]